MLMVQKSSHSYINWIAGFLFRVVRVANLQINGCVFWKLRKEWWSDTLKNGTIWNPNWKVQVTYGFFFKPNLPSIGEEIVGTTQLPKDRGVVACVLDWMKILPISLVKHSLKDNASNGCKHINMDVSIWGYHLSRCWMIFLHSPPYDLSE